MDFASFLLGAIGVVLTFLFREGEFAGTAEEGARRIRMRRIGHILTWVGFALLSWIHFTRP